MLSSVFSQSGGEKGNLQNGNVLCLNDSAVEMENQFARFRNEKNDMGKLS